MRLTKRDRGGNAVMSCDTCEIKYRESCCSLYYCRNALIDKLAAYEDAEEQGLLVRLPCKVGDYVYAHDGFEIFQCLVDRVSFSRGFKEIVVVLPDRLRFGYKFEDIGKTVFLSREEAEAALKGETR